MHSVPRFFVIIWKCWNAIFEACDTPLYGNQWKSVKTLRNSLSQPNFISFRRPYQANVIAAEGEKKASHALKEASDVISGTIHKRRRQFFPNF